LHYILVNGAVDDTSLGGLELMCNITLVSTQTELAFQVLNQFLMYVCTKMCAI